MVRFIKITNKLKKGMRMSDWKRIVLAINKRENKWLDNRM